MPDFVSERQADERRHVDGRLYGEPANAVHIDGGQFPRAGVRVDERIPQGQFAVRRGDAGQVDESHRELRRAERGVATCRGGRIWRIPARQPACVDAGSGKGHGCRTHCSRLIRCRHDSGVVDAYLNLGATCGGIEGMAVTRRGRLRCN
jgi:hypothetical protein